MCLMLVRVLRMQENVRTRYTVVPFVSSYDSFMVGFFFLFIIFCGWIFSFFFIFMVVYFSFHIFFFVGINVLLLI